MQYFIIFLLRGQVVNISSWDDEEARNAAAFDFETSDRDVVDGKQFDEVQVLNQVR